VNVLWQNFSKSLRQYSREKYPIFGDSIISLRHSIIQIDVCVYSKNELINVAVLYNISL